MESLYGEKKSVYDYIYIFCKSSFLILAQTLILIFSFGLTFFFLAHITSNYIEDQFEYRKSLFKGLSSAMVLIYGLFTLLVVAIIIVYVNCDLIYANTSLQIIRGLNLFALFEIFMTLMYVPKYTYHNQLKALPALRASFILANYKIGLSLLVVIIIMLSSYSLIYLFKGQLLILTAVLIFEIQLLAAYFFKKVSMHASLEE